MTYILDQLIEEIRAEPSSSYDRYHRRHNRSITARSSMKVQYIEVKLVLLLKDFPTGSYFTLNALDPTGRLVPLPLGRWSAVDEELLKSLAPYIQTTEVNDEV